MFCQQYSSSSVVVLKLILSPRPVPTDGVARLGELFCPVFCCGYVNGESMASAKSRSLSYVTGVHGIPLFLPDVVVLMIQSITKRKRYGDSKHPCRAPV